MPIDKHLFVSLLDSWSEVSGSYVAFSCIASPNHFSAIMATGVVVCLALEAYEMNFSPSFAHITNIRFENKNVESSTYLQKLRSVSCYVSVRNNCSSATNRLIFNSFGLIIFTHHSQC